ncbi:MAG: hypothetical protein ABFQ53_01460 [Patescibacteria group bacterium]
MKFSKISSSFAVIVFSLLVPFFVFAEEFGIAVDQTAIVFDADTGQAQEFTIKVTNISDKEQEVNVGSMDYDIGEGNSIALSKELNEQNGLSAWISSQSEKVSVAPDEIKEIKFSVNVPENASIGSHRGAVIFSTLPESDDAVKVRGQIGVHVLINVKGDTHAGGKVNHFDIPFVTMGSVDYEAEFENTGNIHYVPYGEISLRNIFSKKEEIYKFEKHFVFPGSKFTFSMTQEIPSLFGFYKAQATFVDGEGAWRTKADYVMGYFFPIVFFIGLFLILTLFWFISKTRKDKKNIKNDSNNKKQNKEEN